MTHEELIASIPTKGVECLWSGSKKPVQAMYAEDGTVLLRVGFRNAIWVFEDEISPEKRTRPMTDREMFGLFAQGAEVRHTHQNNAEVVGWHRGHADTAVFQYRLPGSTEWLHCTVEVME